MKPPSSLRSLPPRGAARLRPGEAGSAARAGWASRAFRAGASWWRAALQRERLLTLLAFALALALVPTLIAMAIDERQLRGVSVWAKPAKFMASLALFALTTAWFVGLLPAARRAARPVRVLVWTLLLTASAEIVYITLQAALGQASHYNVTSRFHMLAYQLMGAVALVMTATQLVLAHQIARHGDPALPVVWREAVVLGLVMTFVLGVGAAAPLGNAPPPSGAGIPFFGWHLGGGDLRPAHFIGTHAQQLVPLAGALLLRAWPARARVALWAFAAGYTALWLLALLRGLDGAAWLPPLP
jgi:hypothetical protein